MNKVEICGVNTSKLPVLKNNEMRQLFEAMQSGDAQVREKLINGKLRLVLSVIQRFSNRGEYVDDLFQVGCIGLIKAIDNFDLKQNVKFSTYAVPTWLTIPRANAAAAIRLIIDRSDSIGGRRCCEK